MEPEVMDTEEDADAYAGIDNAAVNEEFVAAALRLSPCSGRVLDIGTGPGDIAILLARHACEATIVAIDLGEHMLAMARTNVARAGLADRVQVMRADAKQTGFDSRSFDLVLSNSLVHHIPEPGAFFEEMNRVARPGAALFVKDLHRPATDAEHEHLVKTYAADCSPYQRRLFSDSLRAALTVSEVVAMCRELEIADVEVRRCSDRHWCLERYARRPTAAGKTPQA
jgi:ubiquinone/menaquinone biosynthesis C-methylase UbiE